MRALSEYPDPEHAIHQTAWRHKEAVIEMLAGLCAEAAAKNPAALATTMSLLLDGAIVAAHATKSTAPAVTARTAAMTLLKQAGA